jgi:hypothetical protein
MAWFEMRDRWARTGIQETVQAFVNSTSSGFGQAVVPQTHRLTIKNEVDFLLNKSKVLFVWVVIQVHDKKYS